jgi:zinc protease
MDFKKDHVTVVIILAGGIIRETADNRGITSVATLPLQHPATSRFSSTALRDFMTGKKVGLSTNVTPDAVAIHVSGTPDALEDGLQLAHVLLQDATIEPTRVALWKRHTLQALEAQRTRVSARTYDAVRRLLSGNDPRMHRLTPAQVHLRARDIQQAQAWLHTLLHTAPMEVAIVGDITTERALELAATYLGSLPPRLRSDPDLAALRHLPDFVGPHEQRVEVPTITPRAQPVLLWRSAPWSNVKHRRLMHIASRILERRMREEIRENRGLTYSTSTYVHASKVYQAMSALYVQFTTDPDKVEEAVRLARNVVETFAAEGPTDAEIHTVRKQLQHSVDTMLKEPHFWVNLLADLDYHQKKLEDVDGLLDTLLTYSKAEVAAAVQQTVQAARFAAVIGVPAKDCETDTMACSVRRAVHTPDISQR